MKTKILVGAGLSVCLAAWASKDPVVMTINGVDVPRSEFEYLFHKNSRQQLAPQTLEDYAAMFEIYKLKVAAAKEAGLDTLESFKREMNQYRRELAAPYLADSVYIKKMAEEFAARAQEEAEATHIMLFKTRNADENRRIRSRIDSIRIVAKNGADFGEMARRLSQDPSAKDNGGYLGYISGGRYPYDFETAVWNTKDGEISEIVESPMAYHIVKGGKHRAARGKVEVSHIMVKSTPDATTEEAAAAKAKADSIYALVTNAPELFSEIAKKESDDPGSALQGGKLPAFGPREMVPEFEEISYTLHEGEIGQPVKSRYGWHIIKKHKDIAPSANLNALHEIEMRLSNPRDERAQKLKARQTELLAAKHKGGLNKKNLELMVADAKVNGLDSVFLDNYTKGAKGKLEIATAGGKKFMMGELLEGARNLGEIPAEMTELILRQAADNFIYAKLIEAEEDYLYKNEADYRNLLNEYHDGTLLYEISLEKVWNKASADEEGLSNYFITHRNDYKWTQPKVKGYLVQATTDSIGEAVIKSLDNAFTPESVEALRNQFKGDVKIDKILVQKGQNAIVDRIFYGDSKSTVTDPRFNSVYLYDAREITMPEEVNDVKGAVVSDYQNELERKWVESLKAKYPVVVNTKELKKIK